MGVGNRCWGNGDGGGESGREGRRGCGKGIDVGWGGFRRCEYGREVVSLLERVVIVWMGKRRYGKRR